MRNQVKHNETTIHHRKCSPEPSLTPHLHKDPLVSANDGSMKKWTACNKLQQLFCTELIGLATIRKQYKHIFEHQIELNMLKGNAKNILQVHLQVRNGFGDGCLFWSTEKEGQPLTAGHPCRVSPCHGRVNDVHIHMIHLLFTKIRLLQITFDYWEMMFKTNRIIL